MTTDKTFATKTIRLERNGDVLIAKAKIESHSGQHPYFSMTGDLYDRNRPNRDGKTTNASGKSRWLGSCGAIGDTIVEWKPELSQFERWHLTSTDGPMHYLANAIFHAGFCLGMEDSRNLEYLKSTIVYGAVEGDSDVDLASLDAHQLKDWLIARFPALMQQFKADMAALFGELPELPEITTEAPIWTDTLSTPDNREALKQKKRQELIDITNKKIRDEQTELTGRLWLMDHGLSIENVIYYHHRHIFTFGWRKPVRDAERDAILDVISEFPFEYEIKATDKVYSGRK